MRSSQYRNQTRYFFQVNLDDINKAANAVADYKMGLIVKDKGDDVEVPLQQVHIRGKIMDMVAEVRCSCGLPDILVYFDCQNDIILASYSY